MPLNSFPLTFDNGHIYLNTDNNTWLLDTGSPSSFGDLDMLSIGEREFQIPTNFLGLTAETLSESAGHTMSGLIGTDILNEFDWLMDLPSKVISIDPPVAGPTGIQIRLDEFMGVPIIEVEIANQSHRMFFDTGAQISYLKRGSAIENMTQDGEFEDFYPFIGKFETKTYQSDTHFGGLNYCLRYGLLPTGPLEATLHSAGVDGILGNEFMKHQAITYLPSRQCLCL